MINPDSRFGIWICREIRKKSNNFEAFEIVQTIELPEGCKIADRFFSIIPCAGKNKRIKCIKFQKSHKFSSKTIKPLDIFKQANLVCLIK